MSLSLNVSNLYKNNSIDRKNSFFSFDNPTTKKVALIISLPIMGYFFNKATVQISKFTHKYITSQVNDRTQDEKKATFSDETTEKTYEKMIQVTVIKDKKLTYMKAGKVLLSDTMTKSVTAPVREEFVYRLAIPFLLKKFISQPAVDYLIAPALFSSIHANNKQMFLTAGFSEEEATRHVYTQLLNTLLLGFATSLAYQKAGVIGSTGFHIGFNIYAILTESEFTKKQIIKQLKYLDKSELNMQFYLIFKAFKEIDYKTIKTIGEKVIDYRYP